MYFTFALNHVGGLLLKWYRDTFGQPEISDARGNGREVYALIDERMPDGPSPLMVVPHWNGTGTPWCDVDARGAVIGWTLSSTRHDFAKAILEGLTFELLINLNTMEQAGIAVSDLVAAGGGAKSRRWLQLKADILGRPIRTLRCGEAACLGAAMLAGTAAGVYSSLDEAVKTCVGFGGEFTPDPEMKSRYVERFSAYPRIYPALKSAVSVT
jgi:xylulokinase